MRMVRVPDVPTEGLARALTNNVSFHHANSPGAGDSALGEAMGHIRSLRASLNDDPALAAYQVERALPNIRAALDRAERWARALIDTEPGDAIAHGARSVIRRR